MPTKPWEPPRGQGDRDRQPVGQQIDQLRNLERQRIERDATDDVRHDAYDYEEINTHGSER